MSKARAIAVYLAAVQPTIGTARLEAYRDGGNDLDMLARYHWNIALSESLYPALSGLEIALRNSIHQAGAQHFNNARWFDDLSVISLEGRERTQLTHAKQELAQRRLPPDMGRIIAELHFAFWTGLLNAPYERRLWNPGAGLGLLPAAFPFITNRYRSRDPLFKRLNRVRFLRNRIAHYEPIWNWDRRPRLRGLPSFPSLAVQHREIIETIGWINPPMQSMTQRGDRFDTVAARGLDEARARVLAAARSMATAPPRRRSSP